MANNNHHLAVAGDNGKPVSVRIHLCIPDDQERHLPKRRRAPLYLPVDAPLPRHGEVIYLSSTSAWGVIMVIHEWRSPVDLRVEVWLEHVGAARHSRPSGFSLTQ
jgi:hypothetical protein